jgi:hypothetical protein
LSGVQARVVVDELGVGRLERVRHGLGVVGGPPGELGDLVDAVHPGVAAHVEGFLDRADVVAEPEVGELDELVTGRHRGGRGAAELVGVVRQRLCVDLLVGHGR